MYSAVSTMSIRKIEPRVTPVPMSSFMFAQCAPTPASSYCARIDTPKENAAGDSRTTLRDPPGRMFPAEMSNVEA